MSAALKRLRSAAVFIFGHLEVVPGRCRAGQAGARRRITTKTAYSWKRRATSQNHQEINLCGSSISGEIRELIQTMALANPQGSKSGNLPEFLLWIV
jgi:hypothetical protein